MKRGVVVTGLCLLALGLAAYLVLRSRGGAREGARGSRARTSARKRGPGHPQPSPIPAGTVLHGNMGGGVLQPNEAPPRVPASMVAQKQTGPAAFESPKFRIKVKKPDGHEWVLADDPRRFLIPEPGKLLEMHRNGGHGDPRFATVYCYALTTRTGGDGAAEVQELERLDKKAPRSEFRVESESPVRINGLPMTRRVTLWRAEGRQTKFLSVRLVRGEALYVVLAFTDPDAFESFLPDFERIIASLEIG